MVVWAGQHFALALQPITHILLWFATLTDVDISVTMRGYVTLRVRLRTNTVMSTHQDPVVPSFLTLRKAGNGGGEGRTGDCPGPRKETTTRRNVTQGGTDTETCTLRT